MNRFEFLNELRRELRNVPSGEAEKTLNFYDEIIMDGTDSGKTEREVIATMATPREIAAEVEASIITERNMNFEVNSGYKAEAKKTFERQESKKTEKIDFFEEKIEKKSVRAENVQVYKEIPVSTGKKKFTGSPWFIVFLCTSFITVPIALGLFFGALGLFIGLLGGAFGIGVGFLAIVFSIWVVAGALVVSGIAVLITLVGGFIIGSPLYIVSVLLVSCILLLVGTLLFKVAKPVSVAILTFCKFCFKGVAKMFKGLFKLFNFNKREAV